MQYQGLRSILIYLTGVGIADKRVLDPSTDGNATTALATQRETMPYAGFRRKAPPDRDENYCAVFGNYWTIGRSRFRAVSAPTPARRVCHLLRRGG